MNTPIEQVGWAPDDWGKAIGISRSLTWILMKEGSLPFVKVRNRRVITMSPADYLASLK